MDTLPKIQRTATNKLLNTLPPARALGGASGVRRTGSAINQSTRDEGGILPMTRQLLSSTPAFVRLLWKLATDSRVPMRYRAALWLLVPYLLSPIDLIPDFIPGLGALDDVVLVAVTLRWVLRSVDAEILTEHWSGPAPMLRLLRQVSGPVR